MSRLDRQSVTKPTNIYRPHYINTALKNSIYRNKSLIPFRQTFPIPTRKSLLHGNTQNSVELNVTSNFFEYNIARHARTQISRNLFPRRVYFGSYKCLSLPNIMMTFRVVPFLWKKQTAVVVGDKVMMIIPLGGEIEDRVS